MRKDQQKLTVRFTLLLYPWMNMGLAKAMVKYGWSRGQVIRDYIERGLKEDGLQ